MFGSDEIYNALNVSAITSLLDDYNNRKALFNEMLIPQDFIKDECINFFRYANYNPSLGYEEYIYIANCRSATYTGSEIIASAVVANTNRRNFDDYIIYATTMPTLKPLDDTDTYNTPVQLVVKKK